MFVDWLLQMEKGPKAYWKPIGGWQEPHFFNQVKRYPQHSALCLAYSERLINAYYNLPIRKLEGNGSQPPISHTLI